MAQKTHKAPFVPRSSGERVAHARRLLGVREGQDILPPHLAERLGVTTNAVYAWETGTVPGPANLKRLAEELGVTPEWIHYGVEPGPLTFGDVLPPSLGAPRKLTEEEIAAARARVAARKAAQADAADPPRAASGAKGKRRRPGQR